MAEPTVNQLDLEPHVTYYPDTQTLWVKSGRPLGDGETVARNVVVFYDRERPDEVVAVCIEMWAETVLEPFVDAILEKHSVSLGPS